MRSARAPLFVLLALAAPALAAPLDDARRHFERLEYDQALIALEQARRAPDARAAELGEAWLLEGYVQVALGRAEEAVLAIRRALRLAPSLRPPRDLSPRLQQAFEEAARREAERAERRAAASIHLDPAVVPEVAARALDLTASVAAPFAGLVVRMVVTDESAGLSATLPMARRPDGRYTAHLPGEFARPSATLALRAELVDEGEVIATAPPTGSPSSALRLPAHRAALRITSSLAGAEVFVDGKPAGTVPITDAIPVAPGRIHVTLRSGGTSLAQDVDAAQGEIANVTLALARTGPPPEVIARYTLLGVGVLLLTGGAILAWQAGAAADHLAGASTREPGTGLPTIDFSSVSSFDSSGRAYAAASIAALAIGGVAVAVGAILFAWPSRPGEQRAARTRAPIALAPPWIRF